MKSRFQRWLVVAGGLALTGAVLHRLEARVWSALRTEQPALRLDSASAAAGQGVTLGLLGGFRAIVADFTWIRMYAVWEQHDLPTTETLAHVVTALDPRPLYFWVNSARIVAYDLPVWRIEAAGGYERVPPAQQHRIEQEQAQRGLALLDAAMRYHPASTALWTERANIELNRLHDVAAAAASYRRAWEQPQAPYYTARIYGELLRRLDRKPEALAWLIQLYPQLPPDDEAAAAPRVLERIRELERELRVPPAQAFHPPAPPKRAP